MLELSINKFLLILTYACFHTIMPPRRAFRGRPANRNVKEQKVPNAPNVYPEGEVTYTDFV